MIDVLEKTEIKLLRLSKQVTNNEYIITIIKDNQVMQVSVCVSQVTVQQTFLVKFSREMIDVTDVW